MSGEDHFRIRPGRIRSTSAQRARPFIAQAFAAAQKAGARISRSGRVSSGNRSVWGRERTGNFNAGFSEADLQPPARRTVELRICHRDASNAVSGCWIERSIFSDDAAMPQGGNLSLPPRLRDDLFGVW
ncbi:hypothetical protein C7I85_25175 [Mesorhizobium soli]|uniref:Uncharacterized protein n=1 Tax=Pseudaminobacter soli (ex Li et al. 2025) TaxID=1295366 RepID=A0A2P7S1F8_9HYPH|nr:hypothetical protein [Mesorhizobium soli]PSJ56263.1 hypothetical protein C7I85_25175 [Mesorhizobium soli]